MTKLLPLLLLTLGCASSAAIDLNEPKRLLGRENEVRLGAQIGGDNLFPGGNVALTYEIENLRTGPIAIAELLPATTYDPDTQTITINLGSEVPGNEIVPRLVVVESGEKKTFTSGARMDLGVIDAAARFTRPRYLRIKLNFLDDVAPFRALIGIPERVIRDPKLADDLFLKWIENNDSVITNSIPVSWGPARPVFPEAGRRRG